MATDSFERFLRMVRRRRWTQCIVRRTAAGVAVGCAVGLLAAIAGALGWMPHVPYWVAASVLAGLVAGLTTGLAARPSLPQTALAIDAAAQLKDRVHSALQFSRTQIIDVYQQLQVRDATQCLRAEVASRLFPWRWPREGTCALAGVSLAVLVLLIVPQPPPASGKPSGPPTAVKLEAAELAAAVNSLEELSQELESDQMKELAGKLRDLLEQMVRSAQTSEEAMVQLARMTALVESAAAAFDPLLLQQALQDLGNGLQGLDGFEQTSALLKQGDYPRAGQALQQLGQNVGSGQQNIPASGGLTEPRLGQLAAQAQNAGLAELSDALSSLRQAVRSGSRSECEGAMSKLGDLLGKYGHRARIGHAMRAQLASLGECKNCLSCKGGYCPMALSFDDSQFAG